MAIINNVDATNKLESGLSPRPSDRFVRRCVGNPISLCKGIHLPKTQSESGIILLSAKLSQSLNGRPHVWIQRQRLFVILNG